MFLYWSFRLDIVEPPINHFISGVEVENYIQILKRPPFTNSAEKRVFSFQRSRHHPEGCRALIFKGVILPNKHMNSKFQLWKMGAILVMYLS